jgi:hypothetical protein
MLKKSLLLSIILLVGSMNTESKATNIISKSIFDKLYKSSKVVSTEVNSIDWKNYAVFSKDQTQLTDKDIENLKTKSFIEPSIKVKKMDFNNDILYYEDEK